MHSQRTLGKRKNDTTRKKRQGPETPSVFSTPCRASCAVAPPRPGPLWRLRLAAGARRSALSVRCCRDHVVPSPRCTSLNLAIYLTRARRTASSMVVSGDLFAPSGLSVEETAMRTSSNSSVNLRIACLMEFSTADLSVRSPCRSYFTLLLIACGRELTMHIVSTPWAVPSSCGSPRRTSSASHLYTLNSFWTSVLRVL